MKKSFARMEEEVQRWSQNNNETPSCRCELQTPHCDAVRSTAVVADVTPEKIMIANCGDSRAMLCRNNVAPDRPDDLLRIEAAGGRVIYWDGARVLGVLALSRATVTNECEDSGNCYAQTKCINFPLRMIYHYFCPKINEGDGKTNVTDMQIPD